MQIKRILAREILDSRGFPTVEADVFLQSGAFGRASVPSGASTGAHEALELRDNDMLRFGGKGVLTAVNNINSAISDALIGINAINQRQIDSILMELAGADDKSLLGANATLAVSLAVAKAAANALSLPLYGYIGGVNAYVLPVPMMNIVNAGSHSDANIAFQEFMIRPIGAHSIEQALQMGAEVFHVLKKLLQRHSLSTSVGDEGGYAPAFSSIESALDSIIIAIQEAGYAPGKDITIAIDCAASEFYCNGIYDYSKFEGVTGAKYSSTQQVEYLKSLVNKYPIDSIEDGMAEDDWSGWQLLTAELGNSIQLVGDDLFVTNIKFLEKGIKLHCANAILIKPNQIGTLSETLDAVQMAMRNGYNTIISHRSGETEDATIADIAVAVNAGQIKTGSMSRSDRLAKYNQLLRISQNIGTSAVYGYPKY